MVARPCPGRSPRSPMPVPSAVISVTISCAGQHLLEARLLDVQDLPAQREDRLVAPVAALLGRAACGVTLDDVELALGRVLALAVGELARAATPPSSTPLRRTVSRALRAAMRARAASPILRDDLLRRRRVLLEEGGELLVHHLLDEALDLGVAELGLGLPLELRVGQLHRDDRGQALARVLAGGRLLEVLPQPALARRSC